MRSELRRALHHAIGEREAAKLALAKAEQATQRLQRLCEQADQAITALELELDQISRDHASDLVAAAQRQAPAPILPDWNSTAVAMEDARRICSSRKLALSEGLETEKKLRDLLQQRERDCASAVQAIMQQEADHLTTDLMVMWNTLWDNYDAVTAMAPIAALSPLSLKTVQQIAALDHRQFAPPHRRELLDQQRQRWRAWRDALLLDADAEKLSVFEQEKRVA